MKEFGDFQTPAELAAQVCTKARSLFGPPRTIIEPTCGVGSFLVAAQREFGQRTRLIGVEINGEYLERARQALAQLGRRDARLIHADFFELDWRPLIARRPTPILIIGNPPWVTNSELGALMSDNLPRKSNFQGRRGIEARTGKSNFDISEWIGIRLLEELAGRDACVALLLKTAVARKLFVLARARGLPLSSPAIHAIDAKHSFGAAVEACLFVGRTHQVGDEPCPVYASLAEGPPTGWIGVDGDTPVADLEARRETAMLCVELGCETEWRSGIKHDCAKVLELHETEGGLRNGLGEQVEIEGEYLHPLRKSSDIARGSAAVRRWLLVTQRQTGQDTRSIEHIAPRTWAYLNHHGDLLDARKSSIYRGRPRFSIFGVGSYAFAPWKVAISGLHKKLEFRLIGPLEGRAVVFDDTVYFTPCVDEEQARRTLELLDSELARRFYSAYIFWDAKRPITASVLRKLSLAKLAGATGMAPAKPTGPG